MTGQRAVGKSRPTPGGEDDASDATGATEFGASESDADDGHTEPARMGRNEDGTISISDAAVTKLAARAAAEHPDAGAAAARLLGRAVPGAGHLGVRGTDLDALPRTSVDVDRSRAFVRLELAVRWPCSVPEVTAAVRQQVRTRLDELVGLSVDEVHVTVIELVTDLATPPRVQ